MALCRQVHHCIGPVGGKDAIQLGTVADIYLFKGITFIFCDTGQGFQIACIGEFVEVDH
ncbi:hypothetical protein D3C80_2035220 [compost metagenome]